MMNRRDFVKKTTVAGAAFVVGGHSTTRSDVVETALPTSPQSASLDDILATVVAIGDKSQRTAAERRLARVYGLEPDAEAAKAIKSSVSDITIDGSAAYAITGDHHDKFVSLMMGGTVIAQHVARHTVEAAVKTCYYPFHTVELHSFTALFSNSDRGATRKGREWGSLTALHAGWYLDDAFILGSGVGQPEGMRNCKAAIRVPRERPGWATASDITRMLGDLLPPAMPRCRWLASRSLASRLPDRLYDRKSGKLAGCPIAFTEHLSGSRDGDTIMLVDPRGYQMVASDTIYVAPARKADGQAFLALCYAVGGIPRIREPHPLSSGSSFSHFVVLD